MIRWTAVAGLLFGMAILAQATEARAQVAVTTYYTPATPVVTYVPDRVGLFGLRTVYRPQVNYVAPAPTVVAAAPVAATTSYYAPATTTYYAPAPTTTYYAPSTVAPVTTYYAPAPTVVAPAPTVVGRPVVVAPYFDFVPGY